MTKGRLCGRIGDLAEADALADDEREGQARHTGVDVHGRATGEVDGQAAGAAVGDAEELGRPGRPSGTGQQAAAPDHVGERGSRRA